MSGAEGSAGKRAGRTVRAALARLANGASPDPLALTDAVRELARPGVLGFHFGQGQRDGQWQDEEALVVHVMWKRPRGQLSSSERLPKRLASIGCRVDVVETGRYLAMGAWGCDFKDVVHSDAPPFGRRTTLSAICWARGVGVGLVSGHGTVPVAKRRYQRVSPHHDVRILVYDHQRHHPFRARLFSGQAGGDADAALCVFEDISESEIHPRHYDGVLQAPFAYRPSLMKGTGLRHHSRARNRVISGHLIGVALSPAPFVATDGSGAQMRLSNLYCVASNEPFAQPGDSGSLVFDSAKRVVGTIVGAAASSNLAFVQPVESLGRVLGSDFGLFFSHD